MLFISRACFSLFLFSIFFFTQYQLQRTHSSLSTLASVKDVCRGRKCRFNQRAEQPPTFRIYCTFPAFTGWLVAGEEHAKKTKNKKHCQYDSRQCRPTTLLPYARGHGCSHITERGRLGDIRLSALMGAGTNKTF